MSTQYIDINAQQSSIIDKTNNNRFTYQLNEGIELPTGTEISVQSSFINKKGITGGSIEIEEDLTETINFTFYGVDTDYQTLKQDTHDPDGQYEVDLFTKVNSPVNTFYTNRSWAKDNPLSAGVGNDDNYNTNRQNVGGTENKMPYVNFLKDNNGFVCIIPMCGKHTITIPKGTYTVSAMAQLIEDQLNGLKLNTDIGEEDFYTFQRRKQSWTGVPVSNVTNRLIKAEEPFLTSRTNYTDNLPTGQSTCLTFWQALTTTNNILPTIGGETPEEGLGLFTDQLSLKHTVGAGETEFIKTVVEPMNFEDSRILSAIMVQPQHYENVRQGLLNATDAELNANTPNCLQSIYRLYSGADPTIGKENFANDTQSNTPCYYQGMNADRNGLDFNIDPDHFQAPPTGLADFKVPAEVLSTSNVPGVNPDFRHIPTANRCNFNYNVFSVGIPIGAQSVSVDYSDVESGFSIGRLHTPRKFPTHDRFGNSASATSGQEGVYMKRIATGNFIEKEYTATVYRKGINAIDDSNAAQSRKTFLMSEAPFNRVYGTYDAINSAIQNFMSRTGGIMIYNWGVETAKAKGNKVFTNTQTEELRTFEEFFNSKAEAKLAWADTLWGRLGFSYDQLQDADNWGEEKWVFNEDGTHKGNGFTTNESVDPSVVTTVSTIFNSFNYTAPTNPNPGAVVPDALKNVNVQLFTQLDVNTPAHPFNNNAANAAKPEVVVAPYQNSFYTSAVMIPIITKDKPIVADGLPTLSKNGYFLITSNIVSDGDIAKRHDPLAILDVVPVTSLSNQDFITDRNELVHVLSNPKVINNINISILNPDLTNPTLNPNSSILLKIVKPLPPTTVLRQNAEDTIEENMIEAEVEKQLQQAEGVQSGRTQGGRIRKN